MNCGNGSTAVPFPSLGQRRRADAVVPGPARSDAADRLSLRGNHLALGGCRVGERPVVHRPSSRIALLERRFGHVGSDVNKIVLGGFEIDPMPVMLPDGKFTARAVLVRVSDRRAVDLWPDFEPFSTEAEARSAGHLAAVA